MELTVVGRFTDALEQVLLEPLEPSELPEASEVSVAEVSVPGPDELPPVPVPVSTPVIVGVSVAVGMSVVVPVEESSPVVSATGGVSSGHPVEHNSRPASRPRSIDKGIAVRIADREYQKTASMEVVGLSRRASRDGSSVCAIARSDALGTTFFGIQ